MQVKSGAARFGRIAMLLALVLVSARAGSEEAVTRPVNPYSGDAEIAKEGASLFNQYCSHCHGPYAEQGERVRDLRRLRIRYGDDAIATFYTTVNNGRLDKGMPVWKGVLRDEIFWKIYTFLETVQSEE
ncbi:MAG: c-type cytochrome [Betaproteobacteria bacterium]